MRKGSEQGLKGRTLHLYVWLFAAPRILLVTAAAIWLGDLGRTGFIDTVGGMLTNGTMMAVMIPLCILLGYGEVWLAGKLTGGRKPTKEKQESGNG